jgi:hypothetical protein
MCLQECVLADCAKRLAILHDIPSAALEAATRRLPVCRQPMAALGSRLVRLPLAGCVSSRLCQEADLWLGSLTDQGQLQSAPT